jgi:hypothetical protein
MGRSRRRRRRVFLVAACVTAAVALLLGWLQVPIAQEESGYAMVGFQLYTFEAVELSALASNFIHYRGVVFGFGDVECVTNPGGGNVCGTVLQSNGVNISYSIGLPLFVSGLGNWVGWVAPNQHEAVETTAGGLTHLLVAA